MITRGLGTGLLMTRGLGAAGVIGQPSLVDVPRDPRHIDVPRQLVLVQAAREDRQPTISVKTRNPGTAREARISATRGDVRDKAPNRRVSKVKTQEPSRRKATARIKRAKVETEQRQVRVPRRQGKAES